jgi:hypothetical protein
MHDQANSLQESPRQAGKHHKIIAESVAPARTTHRTSTLATKAAKAATAMSARWLCASPSPARHDGNNKDGAGCSQACTIGPGFTCNDSSASPPTQLSLLTTYRDFISFPLAGATKHPDFETFGQPSTAYTPNLVHLVSC